MKFCRNCGTVLQAGAPVIVPTPHVPGPPPGPVPAMGPFGAPPAGPFGPPPGSPGHAGAYGAPGPVVPPPTSGPPPGAFGGPPGAIVAGNIGHQPSAPVANPAACPRCGAPTQAGFAFCQQCGMRLGGSGVSAPAPSPPPPASSPPPPPASVDAYAGTLATSGPLAEAIRAAPAGGANRLAAGLAPTPASGQAWGAAVSVNRDGSDGERFPLTGEFVVIGRGGSAPADIAFEQDRFLARQHARLEPTPDGAARVVPLDTLNGVYRKIDGPVELRDGMVVLAGREVLRFEPVEPEERSPTPLIRHGVALFGSPPREPWARLLQLLPSGGVRDVRHLWDDEIVIGREDGDLVFSDDQFLSRRHAAISWDGARATLKDLGSSNGTFVRLTGATMLRHGDHVRMGDQLFRIELRR